MENLHNNRGIALLVTITVITVLISVALTLNRQVRTEAITGNIFGERLALYGVAEAGIQAGMAVLIIDKMESTVDSVQENWADPAYLKEILAQLEFDGSQLEIEISDELARIQVNALVDYPTGRSFVPAQHRLWLRFIEALSSGVELYEELEPAEVVNPIKDWLDRGDDDAITGLSGAESDYYLDLEPPYPSRNGPMTHLHELKLIKGISDTLFDGVDEIIGLSEYITVYGMSREKGRGFTFKGKININTAEQPVIAALLPPEHADLAEQIVEYRSATEDGQFVYDLSKPTWYKNIPGMQDITIDAVLLTTTSDTFRIKATAVKNEIRVRLVALVQRDKDSKSGKWFCRVLSQQEDFTPIQNKRNRDQLPSSLS